MTSKQQKLTIGVLVILVIAGVTLGVWMWRPSNNANHPDGTWWLCTNTQCANEYTMTVRQYGEDREKHVGEPVRCPKCQSEAVQAEKCPSCGRLFAKGQRAPKTCPHCKKQITEQPAAAN